MKAITLTQFGSPEVLTISELDKPKPDVDQLLVRVHAFALNRADLMQRRGKYPPPPGESEILGLEIAGEIVELGAQVTEFKVGQRVCGLVAGGAYAEFCVLDKGLAFLIPDNMDYETAAAIPEAFITAHLTVFELGQLQTKESILIHAGASGVGSTAIQMSLQVGAKVFFTAGSQEKINAVLKLGNAIGFNYKEEDFVEGIKQHTQGKGINVIEDFIGADYFARNIACLALNGRLILVSVMSGTKTEIDLGTILRKRLQIKGSVLRTRSLQEKREIAASFKKRWWPLICDGKLKPIIDSVFDFEDIRKAHGRMEANLNIGKIVINNIN